MDVILFGALARMAQALMAASPTIVVGWVVAAVLERILGRDGTLKLFGGHTWRQLPYAWLLGMLLPVCSLGVIPIMVQMRKSGIAGGTILAFGLTAPLFNPISVLYELTLSDPIALFVFVLCSLTIVTVMGLLWDWLFPASWLEPEALEKTPYGLRRIGAVALSVCQQSVSRSSVYILIALVGVGFLSMFLPPGCLQKAAGKNDMTAPLTMAAVATLAYITPMVAIVQVASMFQHGNSIGAAFALLVLGTGVNLGLLVWIVANYKWKPSMVWLASLMGVVLLLGYAVDKPLQPKGVEPADHTHAFDVYCSPFQPGTPDPAMAAVKLVRESWKAEELIAFSAGLVFMSVGWIAKRFDPNNQWMASLTKVNESLQSTDDRKFLASGLKKDIVLPNWVIGLCSFVGLIGASILGCFLYYPPRSVIKDEMIMIHTELMTDAISYQFEKVQYWIPIQEDWAHKLAVSAYLRGAPLTRYQKMKLHVFMSKLELLEHAAEDGDKEEVKEFRDAYNLAFRRLNKATATTPAP